VTGRVVLFGVSRLAECVAAYLEDDGFQPVAYTLDRAHVEAAEHSGLPLVPRDELRERFPPPDHALLVVLGYNRDGLILDKLREARAEGYAPFRFVASSAAVGRHVTLGDGCIVCPGAMVEPHAVLGDGVIVRSRAYVGHHARVEGGAYFAPGATVSGDVRIGERAFVGTNATVRDGITIGDRAVVGAGATALRDLPGGAVLRAARCDVLDRPRGDRRL